MEDGGSNRHIPTEALFSTSLAPYGEDFFLDAICKVEVHTRASFAVEASQPYVYEMCLKVLSECDFFLRIGHFPLKLEQHVTCDSHCWSWELSQYYVPLG